MKKPNVSYFSSLSSPGPHDLTPEESLGVICNPLCAGYGPFRPAVPDAGWIESVMKVKKRFGVDQLLVNILFLLRANHSDPVAGPRFDAVGSDDLSVAASAVGHKPPTVVFASGMPSTEAEIWGVACNPAYAGYGPFSPTVDDETWIKCQRRAIKEQGIEQYLVNLLYLLRCNHGRSVNPPANPSLN